MIFPCVCIKFYRNEGISIEFPQCELDHKEGCMHIVLNLLERIIEEYFTRS